MCLIVRGSAEDLGTPVQVLDVVLGRSAKSLTRQIDDVLQAAGDDDPSAAAR